MTQLTETREMQGESEPATEPVGLFHTWWRGDLVPEFPPLTDLEMIPAIDVGLVATLGNKDPRKLEDRIRKNHQPWLAIIAGEPVGYGWVTAGDLTIGELDLDLSLRAGSRYLWDFFTVPKWRGNGIYPRLLQAIIAYEVAAERFWIGHDLSNIASAHGIAKAGFCEVGTVYRSSEGSLVMTCSGEFHRASAASDQFGIELVDHVSAGIS
jgi:GNAT superfamily N-acetyltransferase